MCSSDLIRDGAHDAANAPARADAIVRVVDRVHAVVRDMTRKLRPAGLDELGLSAALEHCVEEWRARSPGVATTLRNPDTRANPTLSQGASVVHLPSRTARPSRRVVTAIAGALALVAPIAVASIPAAAVTSVTVTVQMASGTAAGSYATGFCAEPATNVQFSMTCSDGSSQHVTFFTAAQTNTVVLEIGRAHV